MQRREFNFYLKNSALREKDSITDIRITLILITSRVPRVVTLFCVIVFLNLYLKNKQKNLLLLADRNVREQTQQQKGLNQLTHSCSKFGA